MSDERPKHRDLQLEDMPWIGHRSPRNKRAYEGWTPEMDIMSGHAGMVEAQRQELERRRKAWEAAQLGKVEVKITDDTEEKAEEK
jgi:hypothetical protein